MNNKKPTLKTIAAELGVTHTTVSNAFNRPEKISKSLREKILKYAQEVEYYGPNQAAKSLRTGKSGSIGIIFNDQLSYAFTDPYDIQFLHGVSTVCESEGLNIVLIPLKNKDQGGSDPLTAMVDGYILNAPYKNNLITQAALSKNVPVTVVDFDSPEHININTDDIQLMGEISEHLIGLGHKHIGILTFAMHQESDDLYTLDKEIENDNFVVKQRLLGCQQAFQKHDVELSNIYIKETVNSEDGGAESAKLLLESHPEVSALICFSDRLAYGAMQHCSSNDISVPQQLSITGFDDIPVPHFAASFTTLTTVKQNPFLKGQTATKALLDSSLKGGHYMKVDAQLVIRESTDVAPKVHLS